MNNKALEALALTLLTLAAVVQETVRPIDTRVARAELEGACKVAHAIGYGMTPTEIYLAAWEFARDHHRPVGTAYNVRRKEWQKQGVSVIADALSAMSTI